MEREKTLPRLKARKRKLGLQARIEERWGYLYISPWLIGFAIFSLGPTIASLYYSFSEYMFPVPPKWIGLDNYVQAFSRDDLFPISVGNTFYYLVIAVPLGVLSSLILALLLDRAFAGRALFRTIYYLPSIVPVVATTFLFQYIFQRDYGLINLTLWRAFRIEGPGWFSSKQWVKPTFILMSLWGAGGTAMIIFLAGLQNIPQSLYEAADIDGAGTWHKFANITIPMLSPTIFFNLTTGIIGAFKVFGPAFVATQGGPYYGSYFYVLHLFFQAFNYWNSGYASALAWLLLLMIMIVTLAQFKLAKRWVYYESGTIT